MAKLEQLSDQHYLKTIRRLCLALALFALSAYWAREDYFAPGEAIVFDVIYGLPEFLLPFFLIVTQLGSIVALFGLVVFYFQRRRFHVALKLLLSGGLAYVLADIGKDLLGRPRPEEFVEGLVTRDPLVFGAGFPSGHAAMATAIALTLAPYLPKRYKWFVPAIILGVGLSRIYLGVHAPLDVVGGIALGWAVVELFRNVNIGKRYYRETKA